MCIRKIACGHNLLGAVLLSLFVCMCLFFVSGKPTIVFILSCFISKWISLCCTNGREKKSCSAALIRSEYNGPYANGFSSCTTENENRFMRVRRHELVDMSCAGDAWQERKNILKGEINFMATIGAFALRTIFQTFERK